MLSAGHCSEARTRGTVLLLMPAAVFIMLVLGAIVLDVGLSAVRARELQAVAASAANDTLAALDVDALRSDGQIVINRDRALEVINEAIAIGPLPEATVEQLIIGVDPLGRPEVAVRLGLDVEMIIAPALPGAPDVIHISVTERVLIVS